MTLRFTSSFVQAVRMPGFLAAVPLLLGASLDLTAAPVPRSPVNQVFQFAQSGTCSGWADGSTNKATAYLWIPETCRQIRGLLILCTNVPEHMLVGHPAIRKVCADRDLGILWCVPSFMNFRKDNAKGINNALDYKTSTAFLQRLLDGLAETSGYKEVATVPWLPIGESGHLLMVDALVEQHPERCIAGIWLKNNHLPPANRTVPALVAFGSAQEWGQTQSDIRSNWNNVRQAYEGVLEQRKRNPDWPLSYLIDGGSGHFDCSEKLTAHVAHYIDIVAKARLSDDAGGLLKPVRMDDGFLVDIPVPGHENQPPKRFSEAKSGERALPWFFDLASAEDARSFAAINWNAASQLPNVRAGSNCTVSPFTFNSISEATVTTDSEFSVVPFSLDRIPDGFVGAGETLAVPHGPPVVEWICGAFEPLGGGRFRVALDRTWRSTACYLDVRSLGTPDIRSAVQPVAVKLMPNNEGVRQKIAFHGIVDVPAGTRSVKLEAVSDAGLPVKYYVESGPAVIAGDKLVITPLPPRTRYPVEVTVAAWQWGRPTEPKVQTAEIVRQTFHIKTP